MKSKYQYTHAGSYVHTSYRNTSNSVTSTCIHTVVTVCVYSTAQFKLDRTRMKHGLDTTFFISHACKRACPCKIGDVKPTMQSFCVHTRRACNACMSGTYTPNLDYPCMQIVRQGQRNKLNKHVYVLKCNPLVI